MKTNFLDNFMHEKSRRFMAAPLPKDIIRGRAGNCFDHCMMEALRSNGKYRYCEGKGYYKGRWIHHAWLTDSQGAYAFDPTWRAIENATGFDMPLTFIHYMGAALDIKLVMEFVVKTEYKSPFANYDKAPEIAQKIYDSAH